MKLSMPPVSHYLTLTIVAREPLGSFFESTIRYIQRS
jgi:hypothetical protein